MAKVENVEAVIAKMKADLQRRLGDGKQPTVSVGYTAKYALAVHEKRGMVLRGLPRPKPRKGKFWDPQGRARAGYLLDVARENHSQIAKIVNTAFKQGKTLAQSLVTGGLFLQRMSQLAVPVDTGNLKASAFTRKD
jgi:hypothetical protein